VPHTRARRTMSRPVSWAETWRCGLALDLPIVMTARVASARATSTRTQLQEPVRRPLRRIDRSLTHARLGRQTREAARTGTSDSDRVRPHRGAREKWPEPEDHKSTRSRGAGLASRGSLAIDRPPPALPWLARIERPKGGERGCPRWTARRMQSLCARCHGGAPGSRQDCDPVSYTQSDAADD
jgi:hypothetical protein